jgi:cytochrome c biogenesis protein CcmG/thiol:disulfide interchange protein DsbE
VRFSPKVIGIGAVAIAIVAVVGLLAFGLLSRSPVTGQSGFTRLNKPAPDFTLPLLDGDELVLSDHIGKPIVINFWASWCPPCREESPILERAWRAYKGEALFVGIDIQDTESEARAYLREFGITYPNGLDANGRITVDYGVIGLPVTFFVDKQGIVERRWVGAIGEGQLRAWMDGLIAGAAPSGDQEGENPEGFRKLE